MQPSLPTMVLLPLGTLLRRGTYRLERLSEHRYGHLIYEGTHLPTQQPVLLETLNPCHQYPTDIAPQRNVFLQQAQAWHRLKHPAIEPIREVFIEAILPFLVKDQLPRDTWITLKRRQPLPEQDAIAKIAQIADGVDLAHQNHLLHGDIHPANVVLHPQTRHPMLMNWSWTHQTADVSATTLHAYAAPEVARDQQTVATDIYGLAATLYTLVTGQSPVSASQRQHIRLELHDPDLSQETGVAILRGMAMQPQHRPQSISEWLELLPPSPSEPFSRELINIDAVFPSITTDPTPTDKAVLPEDCLGEHPPQPIDPQPLDSSHSQEHSSSPSPRNPTEQGSTTLQNSADPLQEPQPIVSSTHLQPYAGRPRFPFKVLILCATLSGIVGIIFGFLIRFHLQNQFIAPQTPNKALPVQTEEFAPKQQPRRQQAKPVPAPERPLRSPEPPSTATPKESVPPSIDQSTEEFPLDPQYPQDLQSDPSLPEADPLLPDPLTPGNLNPELQTPSEELDTSPGLSPDPEFSDPDLPPFDPFATPDLPIDPPLEPPANLE